MSVIDLGKVPSSGSTTFDASSALAGLLGPLSAPVCQVTAVALEPLIAPVEQALDPVTSVVDSAVGGLPGAPQQPAPEAPATGPASAAQPQAAAPVPAPAVHGPMLPAFTPYALGNFHSSLPMYNYAELLVGRPGTIGRLQTGMLNTDLFGSNTPGAASSLAAPDPAANDVAAAGRASALPASSTERIALPVLVAVLMLAAVSAALIRSWVVVSRR